MANKVGPLIREARTEAGLTQEELARKIKGIDAADISKAERGELRLTQDQLKTVAKVTGVTQKSLLEASAKSTFSGEKTSSAKKTSTAKKTTKSTAKKTVKDADDLTASEKKLVELYREAPSDTKKYVMDVLKDAKSLIGSSSGRSTKKETSEGMKVAAEILKSILD